MKLPTWLGAAQWLPHYNRETAARDSVAAVIVMVALHGVGEARRLERGSASARRRWGPAGGRRGFGLAPTV